VIHLPYVCSCDIGTTRRHNLEVTKLNKKTVWVKLNGREVKRHVDKHRVELVYINVEKKP
jgi:hypothetical protein